MNDLTIVLAGAAIAGWFVAAVLVGLWLGERGRRRDAQRREGRIPVDRPAPASVTPSPVDEAGVPLALGQDLAEARQAYIDKSVREGFDAKAAAADFDEMMAALSSDRIGVPA